MSTKSILDMAGISITCTSPMSVSCHCRGPQGGDPCCPCEMRHVQIVLGRYVKIVDLGPAPSEEERKKRKELSPWVQSVMSELKSENPEWFGLKGK